MLFVSLLEELILNAQCEDDEHDNGQDIADIEADIILDLHAAALIGLLLEVLPAPAVTGGAEQQVDQRAERQPDIRHEEVLEVEHVRAVAERLEARPDVKAEHARQRQQDHQHDVDGRRLFAAPAGQVHAAGHDVLEHGQHGRERRERHEHEEQASPQTAERHVVEDVRQGDEDQVRAAVRCNVKREARREDDKTRRERHERIQNGNVDGLAEQCAALADIAAEDRHRADAERQREERLIHRGNDNVGDAAFLHPAEVRDEVEAQTLARALRHNAVDRQNDHDGKQDHHHHLGNALQTALQAERVDRKADDNDCDHADRHHDRLAEHLRKRGLHLLGRRTGKPAADRQVEVVQHPAAYGGVEHHQQVVADHRQIAVDVPLAARLLERLIRPHRAFLAGAADSELHRHDRQAEDEQEQHIAHDKRAAAVLADHPRELPYVAHTDGAACRQQDEAKARAESFSLHCLLFPFSAKNRAALLPCGLPQLTYYTLELLRCSSARFL